LSETSSEEVEEIQVAFGDQLLLDSYNNIKYADITLIVLDTGKVGDTGEFYAHQHVIAQRCTYFANRLEVEKKNRMVITGVRKCVFRLILLYLYSNHFELPEVKMALEIVDAATEYGLMKLAVMVFVEVRRLLTTSNVAGVHQMACDQASQTLKELCIEFVVQNFRVMVQMENTGTMKYWLTQVKDTMKPDSVGRVYRKASDVGWASVKTICFKYIVKNFKAVASDGSNLKLIDMDDLIAINEEYAKGL
jgi:hypothetical protein